MDTEELDLGEHINRTCAPVFRLSDCCALDPDNYDWYVQQQELVMLPMAYYEQFFDDWIDGKD